MDSEVKFTGFPKIHRLSREVVVTEKIDGTNAQIYIGEDGTFLAGKRTSWVTPENDNYGFAKWAYENKDELMKLGPGHHFGEWWGQGIQRRYNMMEKRFSLFNVDKWKEKRPRCCHVVPVLYRGEFDTTIINLILTVLKRDGSTAAPGYMNPEGIVIYHTAANILFKKTIAGDEGKIIKSHP
jgi:hypothetical protein